MRTKHEFLFLMVICLLTFVSCKKNNSQPNNSTPPKSTGHITCVLKSNHTVQIGSSTTTWIRKDGIFDINLLQQNSSVLEKKSNKDSISIDMGEWNPGSYELHAIVGAYIDGQYPGILQYDTFFQIHANVDETFKITNWHQ